MILEALRDCRRRTPSASAYTAAPGDSWRILLAASIKERYIDIEGNHRIHHLLLFFTLSPTPLIHPEILSLLIFSPFFPITHQLVPSIQHFPRELFEPINDRMKYARSPILSMNARFKTLFILLFCSGALSGGIPYKPPPVPGMFS